MVENNAQHNEDTEDVIAKIKADLQAASMLTTSDEWRNAYVAAMERARAYQSRIADLSQSVEKALEDAKRLKQEAKDDEQAMWGMRGRHAEAMIVPNQVLDTIRAYEASKKESPLFWDGFSVEFNNGTGNLLIVAPDSGKAE